MKTHFVRLVTLALLSGPFLGAQPADPAGTFGADFRACGSA